MYENYNFKELVFFCIAFVFVQNTKPILSKNVKIYCNMFVVKFCILYITIDWLFYNIKLGGKPINEITQRNSFCEL